jgi:membrane-bound metal-dependent hydrolase YbcI (DUF457 family)
MPDFGEHLVGGAISGFIVLVVLSGKSGIDPGFGSFFLMAGVSAFGSMIPDVLEPATGSYHRSFFHSFALLFGLGFFTFITLENLTGFGVGAIIGFLAVGYLSHLAMDALTPSSLPLIA